METVTATKSNQGNVIGIVSGTRVVIHKGRNSDVIQLNDIQSINLTKKRRFVMNLLFILLAVTVGGILYYNLHLGVFQQQAFGVLILVALGMSIFYKSYIYQISIHLKNRKSLIVKKGISHKRQVKNFYFTLRKKLRKEHLETN